MWVKKDFPTIPGYESHGDQVEAKRWLDFLINQLLDTGAPLQEYRDKLKTREAVCNFVISEFDYPLVRGLPSDVHRNNWFQNLCCHQVTMDYWQTASETLRTLHLNQREGKKGYGDCEDVSCLFVTLFLVNQWEAWECFGAVLQEDTLLGYHGWSLFQDGAGTWRLYEATLSVPPGYPAGYPPIDPDATEWSVDGLTYEAFTKFNSKEYYETAEDDLMGRYRQIALKRKETKRKHQAISEAWGIKTKPLVKPSLLTKIRWR